MRVGSLLVLLYTCSFASEPSLPAKAGSPRQNESSVRMSHRAADSLRQALGLSPNVQIEWFTSSNGMDTISVLDNFNRAELGPDWAADSRYWEIKNGELVLSPAATSEWRYLAVFTKIANDVENKIFSVSYRWGKQADALGIGEGAHALLLSKPDVDADGYWCWRRTNQIAVWLYAIKNGIWEYTPGASKEYDQAAARTTVPKAGDVVEAVPHLEDDGMYFDYYVNGQYDATVADPSKEFAQHFPWYAGVFIHGQGLNNQVDDFRVTITSQDPIAPASVTDLNAISATQTAITLDWTATGDNDYSGNAARYEMRYSTSPLTPENYGSAQLAGDLPDPGDPGQRQQVTVGGLQASRTYYFAMRVFDEVENVSGMSNVVEARTQNAGVATALQLIEGCGQTGEVGMALAQKIVARVLDQYSEGVPDHTVRFVIVSGDGHLQGSTSLAVQTDGNGRASATWTLGGAPGQNKIEIRSSGLTGSPIACTANAVTGSASQVTVTSNHRTLYTVNSDTDPIVVRVADAFGNPVAGGAVSFVVIKGQGYLLEGQSPERKTYQTQADAGGLARVTLNTGAVFGDTTKISITAASLSSPATVQPPPHVVAAPPDSVVAVSGNLQTALRNTVLPAPLKVRILDLTGAPAAGYPVTFTILAGGGQLNNGTAEMQTITDGEGFAQATLKLGPQAGSNRVRARALFKGRALRNSPFVFNATAEAGAISPSLSALMVSPLSGLLADSVSAALVTVAIYDEYNTPVSGKTVRIRVEGERVFIKQPSAPTDQNGEATAEVRSKKPGFKVISAVVLPESVALLDSVRVRFNEIAAARMRLLSGNNQSAPVSTILTQPVVVELFDKFGNAPRPTSVTFTVLSGGGTIIGFRNVTTDSKGQARAVWQLGATAGEQRLEASVSTLPGLLVTFTANATIISGIEENPHGAIPTAFALLPNAPNPFNPETNIYFDLPEASEVEMELYDLNGRFVARLFSGQKPAGRHHVRWSGRDHRGQQMESGVYIYRLRARHGRGHQEFVAMRKLTLLK